MKFYDVLQTNPLFIVYLHRALVIIIVIFSKEI